MKPVKSANNKKKHIEISPFVKSISSEQIMSIDIDDKKEITDYLVKKYL